MAKHSCDYDMAIIGGGLAGLCLAIQGATEGYRVILFEKENYPFHKVCGEYISNESRDFLSRMGVPLNDWHLPSIHQLHVSDMQGKGYDFHLPLGGFGVSRCRLDNFLFELAKQRGAYMVTGTKVNAIHFSNDAFSIEANGQQYTAYTATACFGKRSNLDLKWERSFIKDKPSKINNLIAVKYHIRYPHNPETIALHNFYNGYCGMSRIENGDSCLCYLTTAANLKESGNSIAVMEKKVLSQNSQLKEIFDQAERLYDQPLTISQVSFQEKTQVEDHVMMVGDAAGMITPLCGNGMSMAMHGASMAFDEISAFLQGANNRAAMESGYEQKWKQTFAARTRLGRIVQSFFGGSFSTSLFLRTMHTFPALGQQIIKRTHGKPF